VKTALGGYGVAIGEEAVWVSNHDDSSLSKVDPVSGTAVKIDLGNLSAPSGIGFGSGSVWVSDAFNGVVYRIDPGSNEVVDTIKIAAPSAGYQSDITELDGSMWVTSPGSKAIIRIDPETDSVVSRIHVQYAPQDLVAAYGSLWVTVTTDPK
jgi:streptogramin lyase